jgi:hypothetical protein
MPLRKSRSVLALLLACLIVQAGVSSAETSFVQPFTLTFERHPAQVIVFLANHPEYEAIELMVTPRDRQPPLLRATITRLDEVQIDHFNDERTVRERSRLLTGRLTAYSAISYEQGEVDGLPTVRLRFRSYRGERIELYFQARAEPSAELGGFINPGGHASNSSLPVMWANASAFAGPETVLSIDSVAYELRPTFPGPGIYTEGFLIGVLRASRLSLYEVWSPRRLARGEQWVYLDNFGNWHVYEITAVDGPLVTIVRNTTSTVLEQEVITAWRERSGLRLRTVRATGLGWFEGPVPPRPAGFTLDLSTPGRFSLSVDEHSQLVTGTATRERRGFTERWTLRPEEPEWTRERVVRATAVRQPSGYFIENTVGEP